MANIVVFAFNKGLETMAFNLERDPAMHSPGPRVKRPRLNDLVKVEQGPRPRLPRLLPETADIEVAIFRICCDAAAVWDVVKDCGNCNCGTRRKLQPW